MEGFAGTYQRRKIVAQVQVREVYKISKVVPLQDVMLPRVKSPVVITFVWLGMAS